MLPLRCDSKNKTFPISVIFILVLNTVVFLYQQNNLHHEFLINNLACIPVKVLFAGELKFYFTLLTYMFLHAGWFHYLFNMLFLWVFGKNVEDIVGHMGFIYFYLLCGIGAGIIYLVINPASSSPTIGASGAISGILAAHMVLYPSSRIVVLILVGIAIPARFPAYLLISLWFILQFLHGVSSLSVESGFANVAWFAHIGGFITGILLLPIFLIIRKYLHKVKN
ncbi:MAG: rhomboid family intramembrane serine protease [Candidatus Saelkia tenebricola]|nr:rhomboid family intramembrane serine protease [Candidatus Saelkia tenebricola]